MKNKQLPEVSVSIRGDVYLQAKAKGCSRWRYGHSMRGPAPSMAAVSDGAARLARRVGAGGTVVGYRFDGAAWTVVVCLKVPVSGVTLLLGA